MHRELVHGAIRSTRVGMSKIGLVMAETHQLESGKL